MEQLIPIKNAHLEFYSKFELYYYAKDGKPRLYKKASKSLDKAMIERNQYPQFFIRKKDKAAVVQKLTSILNINLAKTISSKKGFKAIKDCLYKVVEESISNPQENGLSSLPETIEILLYGAKKNSELVNALISLNNKSSLIVQHSVNVLSLVIQYCFSKNYSEDQVRNFCLCALLHDVGVIQVGRDIIESDEELTDKKLLKYKKHPVLGFKDVQRYPEFHDSVGKTVIEHHERLDGSGYPNGKKNISYEAQVVGMIDSYEVLKYQGAGLRKNLAPFDAMQIIKQDVIGGKFNKEIFIDLCSCLTK